MDSDPPQTPIAMETSCATIEIKRERESTRERSYLSFFIRSQQYIIHYLQGTYIYPANPIFKNVHAWKMLHSHTCK